MEWERKVIWTSENANIERNEVNFVIVYGFAWICFVLRFSRMVFCVFVLYCITCFHRFELVLFQSYDDEDVLHKLLTFSFRTTFDATIPLFLRSSAICILKTSASPIVSRDIKLNKIESWNIIKCWLVLKENVLFLHSDPTWILKYSNKFIYKPYCTLHITQLIQT